MQALLPVTALLLSVAILLTGNGLQGVLIPVRARLEGFGPFEIGLIGSCYFGGFAAGCVFGPRLVKRVGHIRTFTAMTAVASTVALAHGLLLSPLAWWIFRGLSGFCFAVLYIVIESWLNERARPETRGVVLSAYMVINLTVLTIGQMLLPLQDPTHVTLFAIVSMLISLAALPVSMTATTEPSPITSTKLNLRHLYRVSPVGVVGCLAIGLANSSFWALAPLFAQSSGLGETGIALFMSATVLGGALGQWPLGRLSDKMDRRKVITLASALGALTGLLLVTRPFDSTVALMMMAAAWGALAFPLYSLAVAHANDHAAPEEFVQVSGGLLLVYAVGAVAGPIVASVVTSAMGLAFLYLYPAAVHVCLFLFVIYRMAARPPAPMEEHVPFGAALTAAQTVSPCFDGETQDELESSQRVHSTS